MKFASLPNGSRDGWLVVVSRDLTSAVSAGKLAGTLQQALERWDEITPQLETLYEALNTQRAPGAFGFTASKALAPLPRAYQWLDASAFLSHGVLMQKALGLDVNPQADAAPLIYQGGSDDFLGAQAPAVFPSEADGIDFEGEFGVILGDVPMGVEPEAAEAAIRLAVQINDWSLRGLAKREMASGFGFLQAKPATAFSPVAITLDELGPAWSEGRIKLPLQVSLNGQPFGHPHGGKMDYRFGQLIAHAARTRRLRVGTVLGSGTVSNGDAEVVGSACLSERRALDAIAARSPTPFLHFGDRVTMEARGADGGPLFGGLDQIVTPLKAAQGTVIVSDNVVLR
jgi:fumarylacetoacetate (FAA) hydrolase